MIVIAENISKIRDNLFLGAKPDEINDFRYVFAFNGTNHYVVPNETMVVTRPFQDDDYNLPSEDMIHEMAKMVLHYSKKGPTLVHCLAGYNRSALVLGMALRYDGMSADDAIALMRKRRDPAVLFNKLFESFVKNAELKQ